ncbi:high-affinity iron transporter [Thermosipho japonicus]|uniref:High-affinity iron transporter n=1 Tax=Thermosipho japonicus TaxID=90323 RepID=A0A841GJ28_9BACT|nr:FTR1 family protein [Thermosipho japonicus]MBB6062377.1 high-affinity iron transporter [Thermosipho japonicus]
MASFIITFREALEAVLIVSIIFAFLNKNKLLSYKKHVYLGITLGIVSSIIFGMILGTLEEHFAEAFEGIFSLIGAFLITTLILWLHKNKNFGKEIQNKLNNSLNKNFGITLILLVTVNILREGFETVIFLSAIPGDAYIIYAILGIVVALVLGYLLYIGILKVNISIFFTVTNVLLILFAAGLIAYGIHELQEAGWFPIIIEHIYDINSFINEKGTFGGFLKTLFGYNGNPSLIEFIAYWTYLIPSMFLAFRKKEIKNNTN